MTERHTVKTNAFPVARPYPRSTSTAGNVNFIVEVWIVDYDFVRVDSEDRAYLVWRHQVSIFEALEQRNLRLTERKC